MIKLNAIALRLDRDSTLPLFVQLYDAVRQQITAGQVKQNSRLPASRTLALELGLSRSTVVTAYEQLVAEGYIEGRAGSGFYACANAESDSLPSTAAVVSAQAFELAEADSTVVSHPGFPDTRLFPYQAWAKCLSRTARLTPEAMIKSTSPYGDHALRCAIARYLADWRGLSVAPEQVLITAGSIDALETCIRTLTRPGDTIGLEDPGYRPIRNIVKNQGMKIKWMPVTRRGAEVSSIEDPLSPTNMVVLTPSHQFPLGGAMPPDRRIEFQQWAQKYHSWIVEDDYDSEFRYAGRPIPALASMDNSNRTIYVGTFSKVFSVGLRLGYIIMPVSLISQFTRTLSTFGIKAAIPSQRALANFIDSGDLYRHIRRVRRVYAERRKLLIEQINLKLTGFVSFEDHQAGMQIALKLISQQDDREIVKAASQRGLMISALSSYYSEARSENGLLLGFCPYTEDEIISNVAILSEVFEAL